MTPLTFRTYDTSWDILFKLVAAQGGPQVPRTGDTERELLMKLLQNGGLGGGGGTWGSIAGTLSDQTDLQAALDAKSAAGLGVALERVTATNNSGNTTLNPTAGVAHFLAIITVGGSARTSIVIVDTTDIAAGQEVEIVFLLPATAAIILEVRNATSGGTLLETVETDGSGADATVRLRASATAWEHAQTSYPKAVS